MRARLNTPDRERRKAGSLRRIRLNKPQRPAEVDAHGSTAPGAHEPVDAAPETDDPAPQATTRDDLRARASGGPIDQAHYTCSCGYVFYASVSTSVACPHCGATQAW